MYKKSLFLSLILSLFCFSLSAQSAESWVFFTDKGDKVSEQLLKPEQFLSPEALVRRQKNGIAIGSEDLPVATAYVQALKSAGYEVVMTSRWLNAVVISRPIPSTSSLPALHHFPFVRGIRPVQHYQTKLSEAQDTEPTSIDYGNARFQNEMIMAHALHEKGYKGQGVRIAIFDGGFSGADTMAVFDSLHQEKRLIATYDFVENDTDVFQSSSHGTRVLSTMGANLSGTMVGTAPKASFMLCKTENVASERQQEEYNWLAAVEWADSIGVDVIHSSLGYAQFDVEEESYDHNDLDGNTSIISRAADKAAKRGILVTTSAGNEGSGAWRKITSPCDADSVLCIGSLTSDLVRSGFSSIGPSADGRVKPEVMALGTAATVAGPDDKTYRRNGTSYSSPIVSGMVACLVQAHPERNNIDIIRAVCLSGDRFDKPDDQYGYGIPNALTADSILSHVKDLAALLPLARPDMDNMEPTAKPRTKIKKREGKLVIKAPQSIVAFKLQKGKQWVSLSKDQFSIDGKELSINLEYLMEGEYFLYMQTNKLKEKLTFKR